MSATFDRDYPNARTGERRSHWPPGVRSISQDGLDVIGVGDDGTLYWDGKQVVVLRGLTLTRLQKIGAVVTVLSAVVVATVALLQLLGVGHGQYLP